jgi:hypothetical protein
MTSTASIHFTDLDSGDDAWFGVRVEGERIGLASSLKANGDIEVFLGSSEAAALRDALTQALALVEG